MDTDLQLKLLAVTLTHTDKALHKGKHSLDYYNRTIHAFSGPTRYNLPRGHGQMLSLSHLFPARCFSCSCQGLKELASVVPYPGSETKPRLVVNALKNHLVCFVACMVHHMSGVRCTWQCHMMFVCSYQPSIL